MHQVRIGCLPGLLCVSHDCFHASHVYTLSCYRSAPSIQRERKREGAEHSQSWSMTYKIPYHYMHTLLIHVIPISHRMHSHFIMMRNILDFLTSISAGASKPLTTQEQQVLSNEFIKAHWICKQQTKPANLQFESWWNRKQWIIFRMRMHCINPYNYTRVLYQTLAKLC